MQNNKNSKLELIQAQVRFIPEGWKLDKVGKALTIKNNFRKPISREVRETIPGPYPYYGPTKIQGYIAEYEQDGTYALIGEDGDHFLKYATMCQTQFISGKCTVNNHAHIIDSSDICDSEWFYRFFEHRNITNFLSRQGAGRFKLNKATLEKLPLLVPPLLEQQKITEILSIWDKAISTTECLIDNSTQQKKSLVQQLISGKKRLAGFEGIWKETPIAKILTVRNEKQVPSSQAPLFSLTIEKGVTAKTDRYNREFLVRDKKEKTYKTVKPLDIVFNPANLRWGAINYSRLSHDVVVSPIYEVLYITDPDKNSLEFVAQALMSGNQILRFASMVEGTLMERMAVKIDPFLATKLPIPPTLKEQQKIASVLNNADKEIELLEQQLADLQQEKKALMQVLLTGKKRVVVDGDTI